jgi:hypothetical protein
MSRRGAQAYLIHFDQKIGDPGNPRGQAQHYIGSGRNVVSRLAKHQKAPDAKIMAAVKAAGIGWTLARTWDGGRERERQLKAQKQGPRLCPVCKGGEPQAPVAYRVESRPVWRKPAEIESSRDLDAVLMDSVTVRLDPDKAPAFLGALRIAERDAWAIGADRHQPDYEARFAVACDISGLLRDERDAAAEMERCREEAGAEGWWPEAGRELDPAPEPELELEAG